jgi:hypothetical protein
MSKSKFFSHSGLTGFLLIVLFISSCGNSGSKNGKAAEDRIETTPEAAVSSIKKYDIKSGIVTFESIGLGMTSKVVLYFDDYGAKEAEEKYLYNSLLNFIHLYLFNPLSRFPQGGKLRAF